VPEAGILKIHTVSCSNCKKELTQNFSNHNDSSNETCQDSSFSEAHLTPKWGQIIISCNLTILIVSLFALFLCLVIITILVRLKRDLYEHFFVINRETNAGGFVIWITTHRLLQKNVGKS